MDRPRVRPHEMLLAGYFAVTGVMIAVRGLPDRQWVPLLLLHVAAIGLCLLALPQLRERGWRGAVRAWLPVAALPLVYKEVAVLNTLFTSGYHDVPIQALEQAIFGTQTAMSFRAAMPWKPLSEYLHFGYFGYYALFPVLGGVLYLRRRLPEYQLALTVLLGTFFTCYLVFIAFPVAGPWYHFQRPVAAEVGWIFPALIHAVLEHGAAKGAAFPSSHAAAAVAIWLVAWQVERKVFAVLAAVVPALVVGTVYGGFHYAVDAAAGVIVGVVCYVVFSRLHTTLAGRNGQDAPVRVGDDVASHAATRARVAR